MDEMREEFEMVKKLILLELKRIERAETMEEVKQIVRELAETIESK